jgi:hypothetical protein
VERAFECRPVVSLHAQGPIVAERHALQLDGRVTTARIERGRDARSNCGGGDDEQPHAVVDPSRDCELVGRVAVEHVVLGPIQPPAPTGVPGHHTEVGGRGTPSATRRGQCPRRPPARDRTEEAGPLFGCPRVAQDGHELCGGREEGTRGDDAPELLDDDPQLDEAQPYASLVGRHAETGPTELDHVLPERVGRLTALDDGAHEPDRALACEEGAYGRA